MNIRYFWRFYECTTALLGWVFIFTLIWVFFIEVLSVIFFPNSIPDWPLIGKAYYWLAGCIVWIIKADWIKYRITKDPNDFPPFRWCGTKKSEFNPLIQKLIRLIWRD